MGLSHPSSPSSHDDDDLDDHDDDDLDDRKPAPLSPSRPKKQHRKNDLGGYVDVDDLIQPELPEIKSKMRLSQDENKKSRNQANMQLTTVQFAFSSYFKMNPLVLEEARKFVASLVPGEAAILLQLLCPVPKEIHLLRIEPNLANGGVSLEGLTPEQRASIKTVNAFDQLFLDFPEKITVFNCRDKCVTTKKKDGSDGRCAKCYADEGRALVAMYTVLGKFVKKMESKISFVSLAGTTSNVGKYIVPYLVTTKLFAHVFGNGYHLSLTVYPCLFCFGTHLVLKIFLNF